MSAHENEDTTGEQAARGIGYTAQRLARNPLGIIGLFVVFMYGFAAITVGLADSLSPGERLPLIYFLVVFPVLILAVFAWLVSRHSSALYAPGDFTDEGNFVQLSVMASNIRAAAYLAGASAGGREPASLTDLRSVAESVQTVSAGRLVRDRRTTWQSHVLWVDDKPENNTRERAAFEEMGVSFTLSTSKADAIAQLRGHTFAVVVADIWLSKRSGAAYGLHVGGPTGPKEGYELLAEVRSSDPVTPFFFYTFPSSPEEVGSTSENGGNGCTDSPDELFKMVMQAILNRAVS